MLGLILLCAGEYLDLALQKIKLQYLAPHKVPGALLGVTPKLRQKMCTNRNLGWVLIHGPGIQEKVWQMGWGGLCQGPEHSGEKAWVVAPVSEQEGNRGVRAPLWDQLPCLRLVP